MQFHVKLVFKILLMFFVCKCRGLLKYNTFLNKNLFGRTNKLLVLTETKLSLREHDDHFMQLALRHAQFSFRDKEVPVGAVIIDENKNVLAASRNRVEGTHDVTMHAEIDCLRKASSIKQNWRLNNCILYTTLEPCPMCLGAIKAARIKRVVFGAYTVNNLQRNISMNKLTKNTKYTHDYDITNLPENHEYELEIIGGVLEEQSSILLKRFFQQRRESFN